MSVELPPPLPPLQLASPAALNQASVQTLSVGAWHLHLDQSAQLDARTLKQALAGTQDLDPLLRALTQAHYEAGQLSTQLLYAVVGHEVYIAARQRPLHAVQAPPSLQAYFASLADNSPLQDAELEPRRALANVETERSGVRAHSEFRDLGSGLQLDIQPTATPAASNTYRVDVGNPGNRFVGRNFLDLAWQHDSPDAQQLKLLWHTATAGLGDSEQRYNEETLSWSQVSPLGICGFTAHAFDYTLDSGLDGSLREAQLAWLYPLIGSLRSRLLLEVRADYVDRRRERLQEDQIDTLHERYPWLETGLHYSRSQYWDGRALDLDLGLKLQRGLAAQADSGASLDYWLLRPSVSLNYALSDHWQLGSSSAAQLSNERLPDQSQWVLGGVDNLAAYHPGVAVGDSGVYSLLDLQYEGWRLAATQLTPRVFAEYGFSSARDRGGAQALSDMGLQLRASWRQLKLTLSSALPLSRSGVSASQSRAAQAPLLFSLTAIF